MRPLVPCCVWTDAGRPCRIPTPWVLSGGPARNVFAACPRCLRESLRQGRPVRRATREDAALHAASEVLES